MYKYDFRGRMLSMDEPDAGLTQYVYRRDGSIRFSQNAKQAQNKQYSYTHYDEAGRPTESGEWTPSDASESIQRLRTSKDLLEQRSSELPPGSTTDVVRTTYDVAVALPEGIAGRTGQFLMGKVSYSEKRDEAGAPLSRSWYSYDERGRVVWMVQDIAGLGVKTVDYTYNGQGNVRVVAYQQDQDDAFYHYYEYGADTRLKEVYTSTTKPKYELDEYTLKNQDQFARQASYEYYLHGPLKQVVLAGEKDSEGRIINELQATDYFYTVQGWLKAINNPNDASNPDNDVFAMQLDYFAEDYVKTGSGINALPVANTDYSGNIQTQSWINNGQLGAYQYEYDDQYQLRQALWKTPDFAAATLGQGNSLYDVTVSYTDAATNQLDGNGNIHRLVRHEPTINAQGNITGFLAKPYQYFYERPEQPNTLTRVAGYADYTYNAIGQMQTANYVEVPDEPSRDMKLVYDVSGKVTQVRSLADNQLQAQYTYDDRGYRIKTEVGGKETYYVRDAGGSILSVYVKEVNGVIQPKEYPIYGSGRVGVAHKMGENYAYLYELKDHLGNVRATVQDIADPVDMYADFYPFGLRQPQRFAKGSFGSRFQYQGAYAEFDENTSFNHFELRSWDPVIGRWMAPDPYGQFHSPYVGMGNNPISNTDPDGGCVGDDCAPVAKLGDCMCSYVGENGNRYTELPESELYTNFGMNTVGHTITSGGWDWFVNYFENPNFGEDYFFQAAEQFPHNASGLMSFFVDNFDAVGPSISLSRLTHTWVENAGWTPELNALEHNMGMFLLSERYDPQTADLIGMANEMRGLIINDEQSGNMINALRGRGGTAFEWNDIRSNLIGISKWREYHGYRVLQ